MARPSLGLGYVPAWCEAKERLLEEHFGQAYRSYTQRTWRLVPGKP